MMLKKTLLRFRPSDMMRSCRMIPSSRAPIRKIAALDFSLSSSVMNWTRTMFITSNACVSRRNFVSVLTLVRCADCPSQVFPISRVQLERSIFHKRVVPTTFPVSRLVIANGIMVPARRPASAVSMQESIFFVRDQRPFVIP